MKKTPLLSELHRATPQWIPTITTTTTYCHSAKRRKLGRVTQKETRDIVDKKETTDMKSIGDRYGIHLRDGNGF